MTVFNFCLRNLAHAGLRALGLRVRVDERIHTPSCQKEVAAYVNTKLAEEDRGVIGMVAAENVIIDPGLDLTREDIEAKAVAKIINFMQRTMDVTGRVPRVRNERGQVLLITRFEDVGTAIFDALVKMMGTLKRFVKMDDSHRGRPHRITVAARQRRAKVAKGAVCHQGGASSPSSVINKFRHFANVLHVR